MHMHMHTLALCPLLCGIVMAARAQVSITELMQSNVGTVVDDLMELPDSWVELHNGGEAAVSLGGYSIGLTADAGEAWALPAVAVEAGGYVLVCCDKEAQGLHTDFRLDTGKGGSVWLFRDGLVADSVTDIPKMPAPDISYGRLTAASTLWGHQATPTPAAANCGSLCGQLLGEPVFRTEGGIRTSPVRLTFTFPTGTPAGARLHYTTDGSEPTAASHTWSGEPLLIDSTTVVRARLMLEGWLSPRSTTHSYIFADHEHELPVVSIATDSAFLYGDTLGILSDAVCPADGQANYTHNWRRPVNIEYFPATAAAAAVNQLCEARLGGNASRQFPLKTFIVYANRRFGTKHLSYPFFAADKPRATRFKSIMLRNSGNDCTLLFMRDALIQRSVARHADLDWQACQPVAVYINGHYCGMLNMRERGTEDNIWTNYDGLDDIDLIENWSQLKEGDTEALEQFTAFYSEEGHTLGEYAARMDWQEFFNLMAMNIYYNNRDFPGGNIVMWRPRTSDGRWRFIAKDTDFGLGLTHEPTDYNTLAWLYDPAYDPHYNWGNAPRFTLLFRHMLEDADLRREFVDRMAVYMADFLNESRIVMLWDRMLADVSTELPYHLPHMGSNRAYYAASLGHARSWLSGRTAYCYTMLSAFFGLGSPVPLTVGMDSDADETVTDLCRRETELHACGITATADSLRGSFFAGRELRLSVHRRGSTEPLPATFAVTAVRDGAVHTDTIAATELRMTMPGCDSVSVAYSIDTATLLDGRLPFSYSIAGTQLTVRSYAGAVPVRLCTTGGAVVAASGHDAVTHTFTVKPHAIYVLRVGTKAVKIGL